MIWNWSLFVKEWKNKPILGYGLDTTGDLISPLKNEAHNDYLRFLVETGLIGLALYLIFLYILGFELWKLYIRARSDIDFSYLALVTFSIYVAWIVGSFADNYITATVFQYYFWGLIGTLMSRKDEDKTYLRK